MTALRRIYPGLYDIAQRAIKNAAYQRTGRPQAVWFDNGDWCCGPVDGKDYMRRSKKSVLAGVYGKNADVAAVVEDMLASSAEILEAA